MKIRFVKYQATGNDFVIIDNRSGKFAFNTDQIQAICDRRFGVGADGLMLIEPGNQLDFNLQYFNSDGSQSLCGNGSRAAVAFASSLGLVNGKARFNAYDGVHDAELVNNGIIRLKMNDVAEIRRMGEDFFIHTGSPHFIRFVDDVSSYAVFDEGRRIRYSAEFAPGGTNVNFVQRIDGNTIFVRTYERGVENETLSCGTGVTAAALAASFLGFPSPVIIKTRGGDLSVEFEFRPSGGPASHAGTFREIFLCGPAKMVFTGELEL